MSSQIIHLKHHQINKEAWDICIESDVNAQPYALSWYLDIVSPKWQAFVIEDLYGGYETVMPLPVKRQYGISYLQQPFYCQQLGIFGKYSIERETAEAFLLRLKKKFKYVIDYIFHSGFERNSDLFTKKTITQYLNLNRPYAEIFKGYNRDRKLNLKRAIASGLNLVESQDIEPLLLIFQRYTANKIYGGVSEQAYLELRDLFSEFKKRGLVKLFYTQDDTRAFLTGGLFLIWNRKIIYLFNASSEEGKKKNGNTLILDHVIKTFCNRDYVFDFESPSEEFENIVGFYGSFGAEKIILPSLNYNELPHFINFIKKIRAKYILINIIKK